MSLKVVDLSSSESRFCNREAAAVAKAVGIKAAGSSRRRRIVGDVVASRADVALEGVYARVACVAFRVPKNSEALLLLSVPHLWGLKVDIVI